MTAVLAVVALASCSSGDRATSAEPSLSATPSTSPTQASNLEGQTLIHAAAARTRMLRSYSFSSVQDVGANRSTRTTITGSAIRPTTLSYLLSAAGKRTQVIRAAGATYVRVLPGSWAKAKKTVATADPAASLLVLLESVTQPTIALASATSTTVRGIIPTASVVKAGLPAGSKDAALTLTLDRNRHVVAVALSTTVTRPGGPPIKVALRTTYAAFDAVRPIKPPV